VRVRGIEPDNTVRMHMRSWRFMSRNANGDDIIEANIIKVKGCGVE